MDFGVDSLLDCDKASYDQMSRDKASHDEQILDRIQTEFSGVLSTVYWGRGETKTYCESSCGAYATTPPSTL